MKDTKFYNQESGIYSQKRYPQIATDYIHYSFKKRLKIVLGMIEWMIDSKDKASLLEVGCADGVVVKSINDKFGARLNNIQAIDLSPEMIEAAKKNNSSPIVFKVRENDMKFENKFDIVVEVGVLNYTDILNEFGFAKDNLSRSGFYVLSIAGRDSLMVRLGRNRKDNFNNLLSYAEYEKKIAEYFDIVKIVPCGFWVPKLWKFPPVARIVQPSLDFLFKNLLPDLFHEKVYLLTIKK
jgi:SAM-dependent methyltransferase